MRRKKPMCRRHQPRRPNSSGTYPAAKTGSTKSTDCGPRPCVLDIKQVSEENQAFRSTLWTGKHLQVTVMCIPAGGEIGLETHAHLDQFLRIEQGHGTVCMGADKKQLEIQSKIGPGCAILIPAGTCHNVTNTGEHPLKLYSIYAPPGHPCGTVHCTKEDADRMERKK